MRAVVFDAFGVEPRVVSVADPVCPPGGVVVAVGATGLCRSDWHGWRGHDPDIVLPHIPGHEYAGTIAEVGPEVTGWQVGDRVTAPFVLACGDCPTCRRGDGQVCENQRQPGFTGPGSFADLVAVDRAQLNLVTVPPSVDDVTAAALGCRFATAYRAVRQVAAAEAEESVVVFGCGGVGLSAVMIAAAGGARVIAVDVSSRALSLAVSLGAAETVAVAGGAAGRTAEEDVVRDVRALCGDGADVAIDALGARTTLLAGLRSLRPGGRHVQVGLLAGDDASPRVPIELVVARELRLLGSHGMAAASYPAMLAEVASGALRPDLLVRDEVGLDAVPARLAGLDQLDAAYGMTMIRPGLL